MRTVHAGTTAVSILFSGEEPPARDAIPRLVENALTEAGLPSWETVEADCFRAGADTLLLARPGHGQRYFWFGDLETLLAGAQSSIGGAGRLYREEGGYLLAVPAAAAGPGLYEFGERVVRSPDWEAHAREQGQQLLEEAAAGALGRVFST